MLDLNRWVKETIKQMEQNGNVFIGGKLWMIDSSRAHWFVPILPEPEQPSTERQRVCDEILGDYLFDKGKL